MFYANTLKKDHTDYLLKMMLILGIVVSLQVLIFYLRVEDIAVALELKQIHLGWGMSNYVATYLIMFTAITFYYIKTAKIKIIWVFVAIFEMVMLVFTESRGGMVMFAAILPLLFLALLWKDKYWWKYVLSFGIGAVGLWIFAILNYDLVTSAFFRFENLLFDDSGRFEIYVDAIEKFKANPIFGGGIFVRQGATVFNMYHNTILHVLATTGLVGFTGLMIQFWNQFKTTLGKFKVNNIFLAISLLGANLHGMVDNVYFLPQYMILLIIIVAVKENENIITLPSQKM
jgi:O-antigen ligase